MTKLDVSKTNNIVSIFKNSEKFTEESIDYCPDCEGFKWFVSFAGIKCTDCGHEYFAVEGDEIDI